MPKGGINEALAKGKAFNKAVKDMKSLSEEPEEMPDFPVPLSSTLPGGLTLKGFMKKHGISYAEACRVYHAYTAYADEEAEKLKKREPETRPVATPARGKPSLPKSNPDPESSASRKKETSEPKASKRKTAKLAGEEIAEEPAEEPELPVGSKKSRSSGSGKRAAATAEAPEPAPEPLDEGKPAKPRKSCLKKPKLNAEPEASSKNVKRSLSFAAAFSSDDENQEAAADTAQPKKFRRVSAKRAQTASEVGAMLDNDVLAFEDGDGSKKWVDEKPAEKTPSKASTTLQRLWCLH